VARQPGNPYFTIYIKAETASGILNRQKLKFHICGLETLTMPTTIHAAVPFYKFDYVEGGGSVVTVDVSEYFISNHPECPDKVYGARVSNGAGGFTESTALTNPLVSLVASGTRTMLLVNT
jgi:hypothetical protein